MITRWDEIAVRTATRLNLPVEIVRAAVLDMAEKTLAHAKHPTVMETDVLGIGAIQATYGKMLRRLKALEAKIVSRRKFILKYEAADTDYARNKVISLQADIVVYEKDMIMIEELIAQKGAIKNARGRKNYKKEVMDGLTSRDLVTIHPKIQLSEVKLAGPGRRLGSLCKNKKPKQPKPPKTPRAPKII